MRRLKQLVPPLLFIFLLLVPAAGATLPWLKEGTYAKYALLEPPGGPSQVKDLYFFKLYPERLSPAVRERVLSYLTNDSPWKTVGFPFVIGDCTDIFMGFRVLKIQGDMAFINASATFVNATIEGNYHHIIPNLTVWRVLRLNLTDMTYYENGTPIGKATLFVDPSNPPKPGEFLFRLEGLSDDVNVTVGNVTYSAYGNGTVLTYYRPFRPPRIGVKSGRFYFSDAGRNWSMSGGGSEEYTYDFLTGVMIAGSFVHSTELMAIGVFYIDGIDRRIRGKSGEGIWPDGIKLYDTNIQFPDENRNSFPDSPWRYYLYSGTLALLVSAGWRWWKNGHA
ncbi:hypothetical protein A3L12_08085 [Thermococcus sp. P6]|uniref:hypothetical protein n=1 Tax=Thermococcus sp. P6 TaxID=122420 RepID=UPI000B59E949|nr:hypothetical protein [Thermococcus sp. P6]ASJ11255.1 hypothetical protein A3L12_08085 [Thermococcus sp. P6]